MQTNNAHNAELIEAHTARLHVLNIQAAQTGDQTPPHVLIEIKKIVATLRALNTLEDLTPEPTPGTQAQLERRRDANTNEQATLRMVTTIQATVAELSNVKADLRLHIATVSDNISDVREDMRDQFSNVHAQLTQASDRLVQTNERIDDTVTQIVEKLAAIHTTVRDDVSDLQLTLNIIIKRLLLGFGVLISSGIIVALIIYALTK